MDTLIKTVENAIKSEQNSVVYYQKKLDDDVKTYNKLISDANAKIETLQTELLNLHELVKKEPS